MLATLSSAIVEGPEWVFEEKYDGIRAVGGRERGTIRIWSRTLQDLTAGFPHVVAAIAALPNGDLVVDGELVALDAKGVSRFQLLQRRGTAGGSATRYAVGVPSPNAVRRSSGFWGDEPTRSSSRGASSAMERPHIARPSAEVGRESSRRTSARITSRAFDRPSGGR